ncbi:MAG: ribosome small subunit-dependent GTPase A [Ignavibacteriae bacterium]|nr:MAG: ribosome small subunit-dependent GTPase A [Ignavibacteriota bacterium]
MNLLKSFGFKDFFKEHFSEFSENGFSPARVAVENKNNYILYSEFGELTAELSGKFYFNYEDKGDYPAVGDWVVIRPLPDEQKALIEHVLPRMNSFSRKAAGTKTDEQVIAANIDVLFIMTSLNKELNIRRMERYLTLALDRGLQPVVILSKADLCEDIDSKMMSMENIIKNIPVHIVSSVKKEGIDELKKYFEGNKTAAIVGSSGVGKSTFINALLGEDRLTVKDITAYKDKGVHTTSRRELILLPDGGMIIDTPGMRELQLWDGGDGLSDVFEDIEALFSNCKFSDCKHESEPGCAVREAIKSGELDEDRYNSYLKMQKEVNYFERRKDQKALLEEKKKWKKIHKEGKEHMKVFKNR